MRIVVSGTHASGKTTLIGDFHDVHREYVVLPDPFEQLGPAAAEPDAESFFEQLQIAADRLHRTAPADAVIAERGPLDFVAYLQALEVLGRPESVLDLVERGLEITAAAMRAVDLLVLVPLSAHDPIEVADEEDPELRAAMDRVILELADDPDLTASARVLEVAGDRAARLAQLESALTP